MSAVKAESGDDLRKHFVAQAYQPHLRTDNTISFMGATKLKQPISNVRPAQSPFQPGMTAMACNLRCHCGKEFPNESDRFTYRNHICHSLNLRCSMSMPAKVRSLQS